MTGLDPLAEWTPGDMKAIHPKWGFDADSEVWADGANDRLAALRPLIAAADELAAWVTSKAPSDCEPLAAYLAIRTTKGDTS